MTTVSYLIIDKLSTAYQCDRESAEGITQLIFGYMNSKELPLKYLGSWYRNYGYLHNWRLTLPDCGNAAYVLLQTLPSKHNAAGFRMEWNPNNLGVDGNRFLWATLEYFLLDDYQFFIDSAVVTRIDFAVDVTPMTLESIWVKGDSLRFSRPMIGDKGEMQSIYLGTRRSAKSFCIYNRNPETLDRISSDPFNMRIEARRKPKCTIHELQGISNPFERLTVIKAVDPIELSNAPDKYALFLDSVKLRGLQGALARIRRYETRGRYSTWVEEHLLPVDWFDPETIWNGYSNAYESLALPYLLEPNTHLEQEEG